MLGADCLKDLQRFLREDDPRTRDAFFTIGQYKTARTDLVPLITTYAGDTDIVYNARAARFTAAALAPTGAHPLQPINKTWCLQ